MWFKQIQLFQLAKSWNLSMESMLAGLESLAFSPCLPSLPMSAGWVSPVDEPGASLIRTINDCSMLCLQLEEKILPAMVIRQTLLEKIRHVETQEKRKLRAKEKFDLKDEIIHTLMPRAFSKLTRIYAYIDNRSHRLVLGTQNAKRAEQFITLFKRSVTEGVERYELKRLAPLLTHWLRQKDYPAAFAIEKAAVLQDPKLQNRIIRCQQQDLFAASIQALIADGCEVKRIGLCWQDRVSFVLADDFSLSAIKYQEAILAEAQDMEPETAQQQFDADFLIMTETLAGLFNALLPLFTRAAVSSGKAVWSEVLV
jgi:recombination associated protein RdgC